jgi:hypothetical protein
MKLENCSFIRNENINIFVLPSFSTSSIIEFVNCKFTQNRNMLFFSPTYTSISSQISFYGCLFQNNQDLLLIMPAESLFFLESTIFRDNWNDAESMIQSYSFLGKIVNSLFLSNRCSQCSIVQILQSNLVNVSTLHVIQSQFKNSTSANVGAFLFSQPHTSLTIKGSYFENGFALLGGCIYFMQSGKGDISNSTFLNSSAYFSNGGAIYLGPNSVLNIDNVTIKDCSSANYGGGVFVDSFSKILISNSVATLESLLSLYSSGIGVNALIAVNIPKTKPKHCEIPLTNSNKNCILFIFKCYLTFKNTVCRIF